MTYLGMSFASRVNGVSQLHGIASRKLLKPFWPGRFEDEVPVRSVTNGIHLPTWTHPSIVAALGGDTRRPITGENLRDLAATANLAAVWQARVGRKAALMRRATAALQDSFVARSDSPLTLHKMLEGLTPDALVIGFARRFAPYKRAHLLFQDLARLEAIVSNEDRPVRFFVAGKAHPRDQHGKDILKEIAARTRRPELLGRVVFLEDYDMALARVLVQGVDVWLNNPTRMLEASGTSGMKAAANGALNLSIGDGWWPEAADGKNGWTIAGPRVYQDQGLQDQFDSGAALLRPRPGGRTPWVGRADHRQLRDHTAGVQYRPHGARLLRPGLRAAGAALFRIRQGPQGPAEAAGPGRAADPPRVRVGQGGLRRHRGAERDQGR
jgi:starch phosphorylase